MATQWALSSRCPVSATHRERVCAAAGLLRLVIRMRLRTTCALWTDRGPDRGEGGGKPWGCQATTISTLTTTGAGRRREYASRHGVVALCPDPFHRHAPIPAHRHDTVAVVLHATPFDDCPHGAVVDPVHFTLVVLVRVALEDRAYLAGTFRICGFPARSPPCDPPSISSLWCTNISTFSGAASSSSFSQARCGLAPPCPSSRSCPHRTTHRPSDSRHPEQ